MINLCGEVITHKVFGKGQIIEQESSCLTVLFNGSDEKKKFIYPSALGTFLLLDNEIVDKQVQDFKNEINQSILQAQMENIAIREQADALKKKPKKPAVKKPKKV